MIDKQSINWILSRLSVILLYSNETEQIFKDMPMPIIISLLRGINVGGNKKIKMADLRELYASLGFQNTKTLLQSGNAVFETDLTDLTEIKHKIENGIQDKYGFDVTVIIRTPEALQAVVDNHPFSDEQVSDPAKMAFVFLSEAPSKDAVDALRDNNPGEEIITYHNCELYIFYTNGMGRSKLDANRIERALKVKSTTRNWNTTQKILNLIADFQGS